MYNEAQKKATMKYNKEHLEQIAIRVHKGEREKMKQIAENAGISLAELIQRAVKEYAENHEI